MLGANICLARRTKLVQNSSEIAMVSIFYFSVWLVSQVRLLDNILKRLLLSKTLWIEILI